MPESGSPSIVLDAVLRRLYALTHDIYVATGLAIAAGIAHIPISSCVDGRSMPCSG